MGTCSTTRPRSGSSHPPQAAGTEYFSLDVEDVLAAGSRSDRLFAESGPQDRVQRRTCSRLSTSPLCRLSMILRRRSWNSRLTCSASFGRSPDPEQVIEVPKILPEDVSLRTAVREPQLEEQLVEVPTIISNPLPLLLQALLVHAAADHGADR